MTLDVKPVQLAPGQPAKFEVSMTTHSVNLDQDMVSLSSLQDDQGKSYQPINWVGSAPGGHHRQGFLEFPALGGDLKSVKLVIRNIVAVPERVFEWKIER